MNPQQIIDLLKSAIYLCMELSLPLLIVALIIGLIISVFQAATQINESTLSFLPKIAAMIAVLILMSPWMIRKITDYVNNLYDKIPTVIKNNK